MALYRIFLFFCLPGLIFSQQYPDKELDHLVKKGIDCIIVQKYDSAKTIFENLNKKYPKIPLGKIYLSAVSIVKSVDYLIPFEDDNIEELLDSAVDQSKALVDDDDNIWNNYFCALAYGTYAYYFALKKEYFTAFSDGFSSMEYFEKCLNLNPKFYEALIAKGTLLFQMSKFSSIFSWLPFYEDNREEGIKLLQLASEKASYSNFLAKLSLIWIYIENKDYQKALKINQNVLAAYPNSRAFLWTLASIYINLDDEKALQTYLEIKRTFIEDEQYTICNIITLEHKIAMTLFNLKDYESSVKICMDLVSKYSEEDFDQCGEAGRFQRIQELIDKIRSK